jgi:polyhydroxyalkanoate synthesis regulator phasin
MEKIMLKDIRRGILAGLGAVMLSKERIEEITRRLVEEAKLSKEDARELAEELSGSGERQWKEMEEAVNDALRKGLDNLGICRQEEVRDLKAKVESLEMRVAILETMERDKGV